MIRLIKIAFWMFVGVAAALESEKWLGKLGARVKPSSLTGSMLDRLNTKLEAQG
ncbi:MAG: hypothetical protein M3161_04180 [Actinomycetota bacterium]|nr:hypothetical protein [Actinomycetota bacterium]